MSGEALVTIVMPVRNGERYVAAALDSLLAQTFTDLHVIVVEDASTDRTAETLRRYSDPRVRVVTNEKRLGAAGARNVAIALTTSRYIAFLDADDAAMPHRIERQLAYLREHSDVGLLGSRLAVMDERGVATGAIWGNGWTTKEFPAAMLFANGLATSTVMVDRDLLRDERFDPSLNPVDDYAMWLRLLDRGRAATLPDVLVQYRLHPDSLMHTSPTIESNLRRIAMERLARLGIDAAPEEVALHRDLCARRLRATAENLAAARRWLDRLEDANSVARIYSADIFHDVLYTQWLALSSARDRWPRARSILRRVRRGRRS